MLEPPATCESRVKTSKLVRVGIQYDKLSCHSHGQWREAAPCARTGHARAVRDLEQRAVRIAQDVTSIDRQKLIRPHIERMSRVRAAIDVREDLIALTHEKPA